jgi:hypothetical protein
MLQLLGNVDEVVQLGPKFVERWHIGSLQWPHLA